MIGRRQPGGASRQGEGSPRWVLLLLVVSALAAAVAWVWWGRRPTETTEVTPKRFIAVIPAHARSEGDLLGERARLLDSAALYMPAPESYAVAESERRRERGRLPEPFEAFGPEPVTGESGAMPLGMVAGLDLDARRALLGHEPAFAPALGRDEGAARPLELRTGVLEVRHSDGSLMRLGLRSPLRVPAGSEEGWTPAEFLVLVGDSGPVGPPLVSRGSGSEEVDQAARLAVQEYFMSQYPVRPGHYRVSLGP